MPLVKVSLNWKLKLHNTYSEHSSMWVVRILVPVPRGMLASRRTAPKTRPFTPIQTCSPDNIDCLL